MKKTTMLRKLLASKEILVAPGAHDVMTAKIIEQAGFNAVYMTGYGASATILGRPDVGLLTLTEMATQARNIANASSPIWERPSRAAWALLPGPTWTPAGRIPPCLNP
ncbi:MAG: isocitrate lyase/phosphoenolpyruvate mutase family protein, partial [bacterium]